MNYDTYGGINFEIIVNRRKKCQPEPLLLNIVSELKPTYKYKNSVNIIGTYNRGCTGMEATALDKYVLEALEEFWVEEYEEEFGNLFIWKDL